MCKLSAQTGCATLLHKRTKSISLRNAIRFFFFLNLTNPAK